MWKKVFRQFDGSEISVTSFPVNKCESQTGTWKVEGNPVVTGQPVQFQYQGKMLGSSTQVEVLDVTGRVVWTGKPELSDSNKWKINHSNFDKAGIYYFRFTMGNQSEVHRLVKY